MKVNNTLLKINLNIIHSKITVDWIVSAVYSGGPGFKSLLKY